MSAKKPPIRPHQRPLKGDQVDKAIELSKESPVVVQGKNTPLQEKLPAEGCFLMPAMRAVFLTAGSTLWCVK